MNDKPQWQLKLDTPSFGRALRKLDPPVRKRILISLSAIRDSANPRSRGKALTGDKSGLWCYRVGDWRIIVDIQDALLIVLALDVDHRGSIYRK
ncbi:MAG: type II toxin-antitoxin system RelE/ParE family toxin [Cellulomonadaceae bacterium]|nr:type II toxin-antitoxin system RelE/ParE family toxin [Cellulomonadaceae bacterium]